MIANTCLYKITGPGLPVSFIFGTMHVRDRTAYTFAEDALTAMKNCSHYYAEMNLDMAAEQINLSHYSFPENTRLSDLIKPGHYNRLTRMLKKSFEYDLDFHQSLYPIIIINQLTEIILREDNHLALDHFLWLKAKEQGMITGGVETVESQLSTLRTLDMETQIQMLKEVGKNPKKFRTGISKLSEHYKNGDLKMLYKLSKRGLGKMKGALLYQRNSEMSKAILAQLETPSFFAIGAAHLAGARGVLNLVKQTGIKVHPA